MYTVLEHFTDLQDNRYEYNPGDEFPRSGYEPDEARLKELSSKANKRGRPVIKLDAKIYEPKRAEILPEPKEPVVETKTEKPKRGRRKKNAD